MMAAGIVLVALGATGLLVGAAVYSSKKSCIITSLPPGTPIPDRCPDDPYHFDGTIIMITSGITAALGVPLWIFGAKSAPISGEPSASRAPTLFVGPKSAALRFVF